MKKRSEPLNRRDLLTSCLALTGATCVTAYLAAGCEEDVAKSVSNDETGNIDTLTLAEISELATVGGAVFKTFEGRNGGHPVLIVRRDEADFIAMTSVCTHQGCQVALPTSGGDITCPCHRSIFSVVDGSVLKGPATQPLTQFPVTFDSVAGTVAVSF